jgi:hypothetical protein
MLTRDPRSSRGKRAVPGPIVTRSDCICSWRNICRIEVCLLYGGTQSLSGEQIVRLDRARALARTRPFFFD